MSEWVEKPLHKFADVTMGQSPSANNVFEVECGLPFLQGCAEFGSIFPDPKYYVDPPLKVAQKDSTLISVRAPVGTTNQADQSYGIGRGLAAIKAPSDDATFIRYAVEFNTRFLERRSQGSTFLAINSDDLRGLPIFAPAEPKLRNKIGQVIAVLDTQIEQTEALISKKENIRQGLMQDLFTRGVDETGQLRTAYEDAPHLYHETELGWLPLGWEVKPLKQYASIGANSFVNGPFGSDLLTSELQPDGVSVIYVRDIKANKYERKSVNCVTNAKANSLHACNVNFGDVLLSKVGDPPCIAAPYLLHETSVVTQDVIRIKVLESCDTEFLPCLINSNVGRRLLRRIISEGTRARVSLTDLKKLRVPFPNAKERNVIGEILHAQKRNIEFEKTRYDNLQKQKAGLMRDLLSGDVSVAPLMQDASA